MLPYFRQATVVAGLTIAARAIKKPSHPDSACNLSASVGANVIEAWVSGVDVESLDAALAKD
jgi:hypothetical protein